MNANLIATSGTLCSSTNHALMPRGADDLLDLERDRAQTARPAVPAS